MAAGRSLYFPGPSKSKADLKCKQNSTHSTSVASCGPGPHLRYILLISATAPAKESASAGSTFCLHFTAASMTFCCESDLRVDCFAKSAAPAWWCAWSAAMKSAWDQHPRYSVRFTCFSDLGPADCLTASANRLWSLTTDFFVTPGAHFIALTALQQPRRREISRLAGKRGLGVAHGLDALAEAVLRHQRNDLAGMLLRLRHVKWTHKTRRTRNVPKSLDAYRNTKSESVLLGVDPTGHLVDVERSHRSRELTDLHHRL